MQQLVFQKLKKKPGKFRQYLILYELGCTHTKIEMVKKDALLKRPKIWNSMIFMKEKKVFCH